MTTPVAGKGEPLVSVVVPCYNQARYLGETLASIASQGYPRREAIVVDDGSSDDTQAVTRSFAGVRYVFQANSGAAAARNRGFAESRGDYLLFLDADDRLLPDGVRAGVEALLARPECGFVWGRVRLIAADGSSLGEPPQPPVETDHYRTLLRHNFIWTPGSVMYRREAFESVGGFRPEVDGSADVDLNLRVAERWPVHGHGRLVLEYREHGGSLSRDYARMLRDSVSVRRRHRRRVRGNRKLEEALAGGMLEQRDNYGRKLLSQVAEQRRRGEWGRVLRGLITLLRYDPGRIARAALGRE